MGPVKDDGGQSNQTKPGRILDDRRDHQRTKPPRRRERSGNVQRQLTGEESPWTAFFGGDLESHKTLFCSTLRARGCWPHSHWARHNDCGCPITQYKQNSGQRGGILQKKSIAVCLSAGYIAPVRPPSRRGVCRTGELKDALRTEGKETS